MSQKKQIARNVVWVGLARFLGFAVRFLLTPLIVSKVGQDAYGLYALTMVLMAYMELVVMGLSSAVTAAAAEWHEAEDDSRLRALVVTSLVATMSLACMVGGSILGVFYAYSDSLLSFFHIPAELQKTAMIMSVSVVGSYIFLAPLQMVREILRGFQRYGVLMFWEMFALLGYMGTVFVCLWFSSSVLGVLLSFLAFQMLSGLGVLKALIQEFKTRLGRWPWPQGDIFMLLSKKGWTMFLSNAFHQIFYQMDKLMAGLFYSVSVVAVYNIAGVFPFVLRVLAGFLLEPLWPVMAARQGQEYKALQRDMVVQGTRYELFFLGALCVILMVYADPFVVQWVGSTFHDSIVVTRIFIFSCVAMLVSAAGTSLIFVQGQAGRLLISQVLCVICSVLLVMMGQKSWGVQGIAWSMVVPYVVIVVPYACWLICALLGLSLIEYVRKIGRGTGVFLIALAVSCCCVKMAFAPHSLLETCFHMVVLYGVALGVIYRFFLKEQERADVRLVVRFPGLNRKA